MRWKDDIIRLPSEASVDNDHEALLDDIMYAGSEKCRHIRNSSRLFTGRKGNTHGKKSSDQVFHETIHAVPGF